MAVDVEDGVAEVVVVEDAPEAGAVVDAQEVAVQAEDGNALPFNEKTKYGSSLGCQGYSVGTSSIS